MQKQSKTLKNHPIFQPGYNITQRVAQDEKMRNYSEYAQR